MSSKLFRDDATYKELSAYFGALVTSADERLQERCDELERLVAHLQWIHPQHAVINDLIRRVAKLEDKDEA